MAELSPVETLRAAAVEAQITDKIRDVELRDAISGVLEFEAHQFETFGFAIGDRFLAVARVLLGVPDGSA